MLLARPDNSRAPAPPTHHIHRPSTSTVTPTDNDGHMALATTPTTGSDPGSDPGSHPGLNARMASLTTALTSLLADLDPDTLLGADATALYGHFAHLERLVVGAKTLLAPRIAASGHWEAEGHRSPADLLASIEGVSCGQAKRTLATGQHLAGLPSVEEALRTGRLSGQKAAEITDAASIDPRAETLLLQGSDDEPLRATKERCQRIVATSARHDPVATAQRIHHRRFFSHWTEPDGTFSYRGSDTPERGAALLARLHPAANRLAEARRAAATDAAAPSSSPHPPSSHAPSGDTPPETSAALRADALFLLVTGGTTTGGTTGETTTGETTGTDSDSREPDRPEPALATATTLIDRPPPATVMVRVDLEALRRGRALSRELCELDGQGPIPVPLARSLLTDSFLAILFTEAGDIRAVSHQGRTINKRLRTALCFRDRTCVVPGCSMPYGLEIDHIDPWSLGGPTELGNLALLCTFHHRKKTYEGWVLQRHGPTDEDPQWSFTPLPPFGQEPDLGLDRKPEPPPPK